MTPEGQQLLLKLAKLYGSTYAVMKAIDLGLTIEKKVHEVLKRKQDEKDKEDEVGEASDK